MPWLRALACGLLLGLLALVAAAQGSRSPSMVLHDESESVDVENLPEIWLDAQGIATIDQVATPGAVRFTPMRHDAIHALGERSALWLHYRLARSRDSRQAWMLEFPTPGLDLVTVFQREGQRWRGESAGDTLAVSQWPEPGRHPFFRLSLPPGEWRDVYVRIRHTTPSNFPASLTTESAHDQRIQLEYLGLGTTFGALLLLIAACLAQSWVYRDRVYAWYALYATVTTIAVAAYTGAAAHLLWPSFGVLADAPQVMLGFLAGASAMLFVRNLVGVPARFRRLDRLLQLLGFAGLAMAVSPMVLPKATAISALSVYIVLTVAINVSLSLAAWRRGDLVGLWVFASYVPLTLSVLMIALRLLGWTPHSFGSQYALVAALALEVPLLLVALSVRSRERHGAQIRAQALSTQDALTGLLAPHLFHDRLQQVVARHKREKESAAVMFIQLVNHARIKDFHGTAVAEQSLLRSVIKLRRLLRDVDTVSRVGEARFAVIMEGISSRNVVTDRAARLIAAGLMPLAGLKPDVTLQFHIAAVLLDERSMEPHDLVDALDALLAGMSPRTRRPIRFIKPEDPHPAPLDSAIDEDSQLPVLKAGAQGSGSALRH